MLGWQELLMLLTAYLLGSIPSAHIFSAFIGNRQVSRIGSGNIGAANVFRNISRKAGLLTLALDLGKGFLIVKLAVFLFPGTVIPLAAGLFAVLGHNYMIFLGFRGGKGVAVTAGVLLAFSWLLALVFFASILLLMIPLRDSNLAMAVGIYVLPVFMGYYFNSVQAAIIGLIWALITTPKFKPDFEAYAAGRRQLF